jgi:hypothetical protein
MSLFPTSKTAFQIWVNGAPSKTSSLDTAMANKFLIWGAGRAGTTSIACLLKSFGYHSFPDAQNSVLESQLINGLLKSGEVNSAIQAIREHACDKFFLKAPLLRAHFNLLKDLSDQFTHIALYRDPMSIALRNNDGTQDFAIPYQNAVSELVRTEWTNRKLSALGAQTVSCTYETLRSNPRESVMQFSSLLSRSEPKHVNIDLILESMLSSFGLYNSVHQSRFRSDMSRSEASSLDAQASGILSQ